jgi:hypothetical protein
VSSEGDAPRGMMARLSRKSRERECRSGRLCALSELGFRVWHAESATSRAPFLLLVESGTCFDFVLGAQRSG